MKRFLSRPLVWLAAIAIVLGAVVVALRARGPRVRTALAQRRDIEQHIVASGRVWVPTRAQVSAQVTGRVVSVGAVEAQHVRAGDVLVQLDDAEARAAVAVAKAAVDQADARAEQVRRVGGTTATEGLRQARTNLERAESELEKVRALVESGALAQGELDDARRALDLARSQKIVAEAQQLSSAPAGADSRVAAGALLAAQAQLASANLRLDQARICALHDGVILTRSVEPGDVVQPSRTLLVMAIDADAQLVFQPDERNLPFISIGQEARAAADAYPQQLFDAQVTYIAPSIDPQRGSVEVRLRVREPPPFLKPDMTVSVDLTVASKKQALVLVSQTIRGIASSSPWVLSVERSRVVRHDVVLGIRGDGSIEIASGLDEGAEVVVPDGQALSPGQRVRAESD